MGHHLSTVLIIDDLSAWCSRERTRLISSLGLSDRARYGTALASEGIRSTIGEVDFCPGQVRSGNRVANSCSVATEAVERKWNLDDRWSLVLLDNQFDHGPVAEGPLDPDVNWPPFGDREFGLRILESLAERFPDPERPGRTIIPVVALSAVPRADLEARLNALGNLGYLQRGGSGASGTFVRSLREQLVDHLFHSGLLEDGPVHVLEDDRSVLIERSPTIIGRSLPLVVCLRDARGAARTTLPCLLLGPSGSGKELVARYIHDLSPRRNGRFVAVNCAALPEGLIESELFGYAPRSGISGADPRGKPGCFELADGGTVFLDEIGDMSLAAQAKLLRILQEGFVQRLSATGGKTVDVRVLAATNRDLDDLISHGQFREDLFQRVARRVVRVPGLAERTEDMPLLFEHFLERETKHLEGGMWPKQIAPEVYTTLQKRAWTGNVRELESIAAYVAQMRRTSPFIVASDIPTEPRRFANRKGAGDQEVRAPTGTGLDAVVATLEGAVVDGAASELRGRLAAIQSAYGAVIRQLLEAALRETRNLEGEPRPATAVGLLLGRRVSATEAYRELLRLEKLFRPDDGGRSASREQVSDDLALVLDKARASRRPSRSRRGVGKADGGKTS